MVSDILTVRTTAGSDLVFVDILSDSEQPLPLPTLPFTGLVEDGTYQDLVTVHYQDGSSDTISLQSDVEPPPSVPTPAAVVGGGAMLGLLGVIRRIGRR